jgi:Tol biopolymer transport system component
MRNKKILPLLLLPILLYSACSSDSEPAPEEKEEIFEINNAFAYILNDYSSSKNILSAYLYDPVNETQKKILSNFNSNARAIQWVDRTLYYAEDQMLISFDAETSSSSELLPFSNEVLMMRVSPNKKFVTYLLSGDGGIRIANLESGPEIVDLGVNSFPIPSWSSDSKYLLVPYEIDDVYTLLVYDVENQEIFREFTAEAPYVINATWRPGTSEIYYGDDDDVYTYDIITEATDFRQGLAEWTMQELNFSSDGRYMSFLDVLNRSYIDHELHILDLDQNTEYVLPDYRDVFNTKWSRSSNKMIYNRSNRINAFDAATNTESELLLIPEVNESQILIGHVHWM